MKKAIGLILAVLLTFSVTACGNKGDDGTSDEKTALTEVTVDENYARYDLADAPLINPTEGFGAQIDPDNYMPYNQLTPEEEAMIDERVGDMNLQFCRVKMHPEYFERANDNDDPNVFDYDAEGVDFESREMQALYKVLDLAEKHHMNVDLSYYGPLGCFKSVDGKYQGSWIGWKAEDATVPGTFTPSWVVAPKKTEDFDGHAEYAENIYVLLDHLLNVKKYTCIWGFSVISESFVNAENVVDHDAYLDCCKVIRARMQKEGMLEKVPFLGITFSATPKGVTEELQGVGDMYDTFVFGNYNWDNNDPIEAAYNYFEDMMNVLGKRNKKMYIAEFCEGKHFIDAVNKTDIDDYDAGLYIARVMIAASTYGVSAMDHYILGDTFFNNQYVHTMGLWQYRNFGWKAHPEYYFMGLFTKYTDIGSYVYPIRTQDDQNLAMVAFKLPSGAWSYMCLNNDTKSKKVAVVNKGADRPDSMNVYRVTESSIPEDRAVVLPGVHSTVETKGGVAYVTLPAKSFTVLSDKA